VEPNNPKPDSNTYGLGQGQGEGQGEGEGEGEGRGHNPLSLKQQPEPVGKIDPDFSERWQVGMPDGVLKFEDCEMEEERWQRFLDDKGEALKGRSRSAVEEYIQVGGITFFGL